MSENSPGGAGVFADIADLARRLLQWFWALSWKAKGPALAIATLVTIGGISSLSGGAERQPAAGEVDESQEEGSPGPSATPSDVETPTRTPDTEQASPTPTDTRAAVATATASRELTVTATPPPAATNTPVPTPTSAPPTATLASSPTMEPTATATAFPTVQSFSLPGCYQAGVDGCNCGHFNNNHAWAQWFHDNYDPQDINGLDGNNDGVVCEGLL